VANRYWVGGTAAWDGTAGTKWAATSGGAGGETVPTSADDVFFDAASGTGTVTITLAVAKSVDFTGFTGTIASGTTPSFEIYGSLTFSAGMTINYTNAYTFRGTGTLTTNGKTIPGIIFCSTGSVVTLGDALTTNSTITIGNSGTFNTANYSVTAASFNCSSGTANFGSSTATITGAGSAFIRSSGFNFNAGTSTFIFVSNNITIDTPGDTFYNVQFSNTSPSSSASITLRGANTFNNLTIATLTSIGRRSFVLEGNNTVNGVLTAIGGAGNQRININSSQLAVRTLTLNSAPNISDVSFYRIRVIGTAAPISGTRLGNFGGCSGITFSAPKTVYWVGASGSNWSGSTSWANSSGGGATTDAFPLPQDTAVIDNAAPAASGSIVLDSNIGATGAVSFASRTNAVTVNANSTTIYGSWTNSSAVSFTGTSEFVFAAVSAKQTIISAGVSFNRPLTIAALDGVVELADALSIGGFTLTVTQGTFITNGYSITASSFTSSSNTDVRSIYLGNSTITLTGNSPLTISSMHAPAFTFEAGTSQINISASGSRTASFGNKAYNIINISSLSSVFYTTFNDGFAANQLIIDQNADGNGFVSFNFGSTYSIQQLQVISTSPVRRLTLKGSALSSSNVTIGSLSAPNTNFRNINILGGAVGTAPVRAGDCGGVTGIVFPAPKTVYWNLAGTQNWTANGWALTSGGTPQADNYPLPQDTVVFDDAGAAGAINVDPASFILGTINAAARTAPITLNFAQTSEISGNLTLSSAVTTTGTGQINFISRNNQFITSAGVSLTAPLNFASAATVQLMDALTTSNTLSIGDAASTFDAATYNVTCALFSSSVGTLKMGTGTWTLTGTGTVWLRGSASACNTDVGSANIVISGTSNVSRTFTLGTDNAYNKLTIGGGASTGTIVLGNSGSFTELASTRTAAYTIDFGSSIFVFGKWSVTGSLGNVVTLSGTSTTNSIEGPCTSGIDYLALGNIRFGATSPGEFYAGANSTATGVPAAPTYLTAKPADSTRYWVGGSGNWSDTAKWSTSSGGSGGASVPRSTDDVIFDAASNATGYTVTIDTITGGNRCKALTFGGPASGTLTLAGTAALYIHGNFAFPSTAFTNSWTGGTVFTGGDINRTVQSNGKSFSNSPMTVVGEGCGVVLLDALTTNTSITVNRGEFNAAGYSITASDLISIQYRKRTIKLGAATHTFSSIGTPINFNRELTSSFAFNFDAGTSQINLPTFFSIFSGGNKTFYNVTLGGMTGGGITQVNGAATFNNLTFRGKADVGGLHQYNLSANLTVNGALTIQAGVDARARSIIQSNSVGTTRSISANSVVMADVDFRDIAITGAAAPASGTRIGDGGGNSGITFTPAANKYWVGTTSGTLFWTSANVWATSSGGTGATNNYPLPQDRAIIENVGLTSTATLSITTTINISTIDFSLRTTALNMSFVASSNYLYGDLITSSAITYTGLNKDLVFYGRGLQKITSAGKTIPGKITSYNFGGTLRLEDALQCTQLELFSTGGFDANNYNVTFTATGLTNSVSATPSFASINFGSGTWTLPASFSTNNLSAVFTGTGTVNFTKTSGSVDFIVNGTQNLSGVTINIGGAATVGIFGGLTFKDITNTNKMASASTLSISSSSVLQLMQFSAAGEAGRLLTIRPTGTFGSIYYLGNGLINTDYLNVNMIYAYPISGRWYAGTNSTITAGYLGWNFTTGGTVYASDVAETGAPADALGTVATLGVNVTDAAVGADTEDAFTTMSMAVSEAAIGSEALNSNAIFAAAIPEAASATDSLFTQAVFNADADEAGVVADALTLAAILGVNFADTAVGADAEDAFTLMSVAIVEVARASEIADAQMMFSASVPETAAVFDAQAAAVAFSSVVAETSSANDVPAVAPSTFGVTLSEAVTVAEIPAVISAVFGAAFADSIRISDSLIGRLAWDPIDNAQNANWLQINNTQAPNWLEPSNTQSPNWTQT